MKFIIELVGTFVLVLTVGMTVVSPNAGMLAPLAIASALMTMVYAGGHVSGGHYNPAVSLGVFLRGRLGLVDMVLYWVAQLVGALCAAAVVIFFKGDVAQASSQFDMARVFLAEFLFTFVLVLVVLQVATSKRTAGNSYFGVAIGAVIIVGAYSVGSISGGAFNPAVAVGAVLLNLSSMANLWVYVAAQFIAAACAALLFRLTEKM